MNVALYAPLKAPTHPVPSGDRAMAQALIAALELAGHPVTLASGLRLYDGQGHAGAQDVLIAKAGVETARILADPAARTWRAWITYHNYYKAPDLIGPGVCAALDIPYIQVESTRARKRLNGLWARFAHAAEAASDAAHTIFYVTRRDSETLQRDAPPGQVLQHLPPFLARTDLSPASDLTGGMLCVAMMRAGDKLASYALVADTLALLPEDGAWRLDIAGDGDVRAEVAALMAPLGDRVRFHGLLDAAGLGALYARAGLLFWPGVNEAFGLAYLEAQAAGLPVVAQDRDGVRDVVSGPQPTIAQGPQGMADRITRLLGDADVRAAAGADARRIVGERHLLGPAARTLAQVLEGLA